MAALAAHRLVVVLPPVYYYDVTGSSRIAIFFCGFLTILGLNPIQKALHISVPGEQLGMGVAALAIICMVVFSLIFPNRKKGEI